MLVFMAMRLMTFDCSTELLRRQSSVCHCEWLIVVTCRIVPGGILIEEMLCQDLLTFRSRDSCCPATHPHSHVDGVLGHCVRAPL